MSEGTTIVPDQNATIPQPKEIPLQIVNDKAIAQAIAQNEGIDGVDSNNPVDNNIVQVVPRNQQNSIHHSIPTPNKITFVVVSLLSFAVIGVSVYGIIKFSSTVSYSYTRWDKTWFIHHNPNPHTEHYQLPGLFTFYIVLLIVTVILWFFLCCLLKFCTDTNNRAHNVFVCAGFHVFYNVVAALSGGFCLFCWCCLVCTCFSADSMVWVQKNAVNGNVTNYNDGMVQLRICDLEIGDKVLTMNPFTNETYFEEVLLKIHYSWYDNANDYYSMRTLYLQDNISSITLSNDHLIFIQEFNTKSVKIIPTQLVNISDILFYYNHQKNETLHLSVVGIDENVMSQKRVFFTLSPYVLINNVLASPYVGAHAIYHTILHGLFVKFIFIRHFVNQFVLFVISKFIHIFIYLSGFILLYWMECSVVLFTYFSFYFLKG